MTTVCAGAIIYSFKIDMSRLIGICLIKLLIWEKRKVGSWKYSGV
jgi:hypothetical protein